MSHSYDTSTYAADASQVPARLESPDELSALSTAAFLEQQKSPDPLVYVSGTTRSGWAVYTSKNLLEAVDLLSLAFLSDRGQHRFETEHGFTAVTVLAPSALSSVAADLRQLLERVKAEPMLALRADTDGSMFGVDEIAEAVARDYVTWQPAFDYGNVRGDEGQGPDYFFTWLRSILRVVEVAQARGQAVVHELKV
jgi:hypothetical protein